MSVTKNIIGNGTTQRNRLKLMQENSRNAGMKDVAINVAGTSRGI
jgi:hypothetical protein